MTILYRLDNQAGVKSERLLLMQDVNFSYEIVISDDCSSDGTRLIINEFKERYPDVIRDVSPLHNIGVIENLAHVLSCADGKYVAICEGDDFWTDSGKLQKQIDLMESDPECSLCYHASENLFDETFFEPRLPIAESVDESYTFDDLVLGYPFQTSSVVLKTSAVRSPLYRKCVKYGITSLPLFWLVSCQGTMRGFNEKMSVFRRHGASFINTHAINARLSFIKIVIRTCSLYSKPYSEKLYVRIAAELDFLKRHRILFFRYLLYYCLLHPYRGMLYVARNVRHLIAKRFK